MGRVPPNEEKGCENGDEGESYGDDETEVMKCHALPYRFFLD